MIRIDNELFQIANLNAATNQLTVTRAMRDNFLNVPTVQAAHAIGAEVWANRVTCLVSARTTPTASMLGPEEREDTAIVDGQYFTTLFNSS